MNTLLPAVLTLACHGLPAATLLVGPGLPFPTIAAAVAAAAPGDLILVSPGIYGEFAVSKPLTILGNGGTFTVTQTGAAAIKVTGITGTFVLQDAVFTMNTLAGPSILISGCSGDVRLRNVTVNTPISLGGTLARAAIEAENCADVILEDVVVGGGPARQARTTRPDGSNDAVSALRMEDTQFLVQGGDLRGYDAPSGGPFAGDAVRVVHSGVLTPASCWLLRGPTTLALRGGNAANGNGGNCLHLLGANLAAERCGTMFLQPGTGSTLAGGEFAINNDGGQVAPGLGRSIAACVGPASGFTTAPAVAAAGTNFNVAITTFAVPTTCALLMSFASRFQHTVFGVSGRFLLDPATLATIGFGTTTANFTITLPASPSLAGLPLAFQGTLFQPSGLNVNAMTAPAFVSVR